MFDHLSLRLRIFLLFALIALGGSALVIGGLIIGFLRLDSPPALSAFVIAGLIGVAAVIALTTWVWTLFDEHVARPVEKIAGEMRARAHSSVDLELDSAAARYLGDLAPAAAAVAENLTEARNKMALEVGRATARLSAEKAQLEAMLAEVPEGVLFCTPDHKIALYNARAKQILGDSPELGLNRPIKGLLRLAPITQAYARLSESPTPEGADVLAASRNGSVLLEARMRLMQVAGQEDGAPGYVLCLRDVSSDLAVHAERAHLLEEAIDAGHEVLEQIADHPAAERLSRRLSQIETRKAPTDTQWWPMEALSASDLGAALYLRLSRKGVDFAYELPQTMLRCDGFAIVRLIERLALNWQNAGAGAIRLSVAEGAESTELILSSDGDLPNEDTVKRWLSAPLSPGLSSFSGRDVVHSHGTRLVIEDGLRMRFMRAKPGYIQPSLVEYDFDLLKAEMNADMAAMPLSQLCYAVFDSETTGLTPESDEMCQLAAVRVMNGRLLETESFDMLVNPGRPIPRASSAVHGITDDMVEDAPPPGEAIGRFHRYCDGAVLVAHNAPFDMAFLQRREAEIGARFDQPILDTVLISAILFGASSEHTLDALCDRLGITIPDSARHTALGDALGTAHALVKSLPMLEARGFGNLGKLVKEFDRYSRLIANLN